MYNRYKPLEEVFDCKFDYAVVCFNALEWYHSVSESYLQRFILIYI